MRAQPAEVYQRLAPCYDRLMAHVDYAMWADYVRALCERHGLDPRACFDAACGTGRFLAELDTSGLRLAGADGSQSMLEQARRRLPRRVRLSCQDLRELVDGKSWPLVTCLYDSLNYLLEPTGLASALARLAALVGEGGLVVFDICTERNSLQHFLDRSEQGQADGWNWERHSWYEQESRLHHNEFLVEHVASGRRFTESHRQRIYTVDEVARQAQDTGLELLGRYADFSLRPGDESADRVHFVTRRAKRRRMNGNGALPRLPLLEARGLEFQYPGGFRLGPLDLRLHAGELVCLMGEPGAGKSTLLRLLAARLLPGAGGLLFRQEPLTDLRPAGLAAWRRRLGILEQGGLTAGLRSTRELMNLALATRGLGPRARRRESTRLLGELGLLARADLPCGDLSTGQARWAQLALALCGLPDVLLLDEPLAHLSAEHQADFMTALRRVAARGAGVLFCRHGDSAQAGDGLRRLMLAGGRLTELDAAPDWRPR